MEDDYSDPYALLFDEDQARKAASAVKIFQDVSVGSSKEKMKEEGRQQRETLAQQQRFSEKDEERDYNQAQRAYRF
jgi:hypothetical protein